MNTSALSKNSIIPWCNSFLSLRKQLMFVVTCSIMISEFQFEKVNPLQIWLYINIRRKTSQTNTNPEVVLSQI